MTVDVDGDNMIYFRPQLLLSCALQDPFIQLKSFLVALRCLHVAILHHAGVLWHPSLLPGTVLWSVR